MGEGEGEGESEGAINTFLSARTAGGPRRARAGGGVAAPGLSRFFPNRDRFREPPPKFDFRK